MEEIIRHILEIEEQAKKIVEDSRKKAGALIENAHAEARRIGENSRTQALQQATDILQNSLRTAQETKAKRLDEIRRNAICAKNIESELHGAAVKKSASIIAGLESQ